MSDQINDKTNDQISDNISDMLFYAFTGVQIILTEI